MPRFETAQHRAGDIRPLSRVRQREVLAFSQPARGATEVERRIVRTSQRAAGHGAGRRLPTHVAPCILRKLGCSTVKLRAYIRISDPNLTRDSGRASLDTPCLIDYYVSASRGGTR